MRLDKDAVANRGSAGKEKRDHFSFSTIGNMRKKNELGLQMQRAEEMRSRAYNPVGRLRAIVERMISELKQAEAKAPLANFSRRWALIEELDAVCHELEGLRNLALCHFLDKKLAEAKREAFDGDVAVVYIPLKAELPDEYWEVRAIVIDACGYNLEPYAYKLLGECGKGFFTSGIETEGGAL